MPNPFGQIVDTSRSGGRSVSEMWQVIFEANEKAFREERFGDVLTDGQISTLMYFAFPDRIECQVFRQVRKVRAAYNRGALKGVPQRRRQATEFRRFEDETVVRR